MSYYEDDMFFLGDSIGSDPRPAAKPEPAQWAPRRGALAFCSENRLGLITVDEPQLMTYNNGTSGLAWIGVHVRDYPEDDIKIGDPWSSRSPRVDNYIQEIL